MAAAISASLMSSPVPQYNGLSLPGSERVAEIIQPAVEDPEAHGRGPGHQRSHLGPSQQWIDETERPLGSTVPE